MTKPRRKDMPSWARWRAQDGDGTWHWFECQPRYNKRLKTWTTRRGEVMRATPPKAGE
ncbi:MAG: hypothetical protein OEZ68_15705 [Gammaproteobacteria bacterium]|nr:hypothetical protein [Gammaproteobacteria bacterium]MDH5802246.1 hypothetical protein [Gammaproteobacteria bacterium]